MEKRQWRKHVQGKQKGSTTKTANAERRLKIKSSARAGKRDSKKITINTKTGQAGIRKERQKDQKIQKVSRRHKQTGRGARLGANVERTRKRKNSTECERNTQDQPGVGKQAKSNTAPESREGKYAKNQESAGNHHQALRNKEFNLLPASWIPDPFQKQKPNVPMKSVHKRE